MTTGQVHRAAFSAVCKCGITIHVFDEPQAVGHEQPTCKEFDELEPIEFLRYINGATTQ